ncbi:TonB-dependent siderophore receptor [Rhizobiaceae bacterium CRRU44]|uniref:TonB-dependent siderophore receptor n=1 Tax=Ferranicluibacter rubi TaxID=2715133 RepID=A0AA43ZHM8_9HYPH|nr:TonB-dependent siderophore receptor [Ferranicluibacter rubi]NHT77205.1 TonB-dependent siderophore receptor [Ferranicluibacter rubi]
MRRGSMTWLAGIGRRGIVVTILVTPAMAAGTWVASPALAQTKAQPQIYAIPAGPLSAALAAFGRQSGTQIAYEASVARDKTSPGLSGSATREEAIARLLSGTGVDYTFTDASSILVTSAATDAGGPAADGATVLEPITVHGNGETAFGPVEGYVAKRTATASKTDASLMETPQAVNIVTADQLADQSAQTMTEALRYTPGVLGGLEGAGDTRRDPITVRGFEPALYLDGVLATSGGALTAVTKPEPYNFERLEILKGPASVLYGANSPGGLVNAVSKRPTDEARGEVTLEGGSYDRLQEQFDVSGPLDADGTLLYRLVGVNRNADTQVDFQPDDHRFLAPSFTWKPDEDTSLTLLGQYSKDDGGVYQSLPLRGTLLSNPFGSIPRHRTGGDKAFDHYDSEYWNIGSVFDHRINDAITFSQTVRYGEHDNDYAGAYISGLRDDLRTADRVAYVYRNQAQSLAIDNRLAFEFDTGAASHSLLVGFDYNRLKSANQNGEMAIDPIDVFNPVYGHINPVPIAIRNNNLSEQTGIYLQDVVRLDALTLMVGVRHDWARSDVKNPFYAYDATDEATSYRVGATYQFDNGIAPYASYSESFALKEGMRADGGTWKPTTGQQYEIGVRYEIPGTDTMVTLSAFDLKQQNNVSAVPNTPFSVQTGEIGVRGIEAEIKASLDSGWDLTASTAYLDGEITEDADSSLVGDKAFNTPDVTASLWVDYTFQADDALGGLTLGGGVRHIGNYVSSQYEKPYRETPAATLFDAHVKYDFAALGKDYEGLSLSLNVTNLFDKRHYAYVDNYFTTDAPGREISARLGYKW